MSTAQQFSLFDEPAVEAAAPAPAATDNRGAAVDALIGTMDLPPCPICSHFKKDHPDLWEDALAIPTIVGGRDGRSRLVGPCPHVKPLFGSYETADEARARWAAEVIDLAKRKRKSRSEINVSIARILEIRAKDTFAKTA